MPGRIVLTVLAALVLPVLAAAQIVPEPELDNRLINLPTHLVLPPGTLQVVFTHRFSQTVGNGGSGNLYGLDSAADIGIGLGMGFGHGLEAEVYRSSFFKQIEAAVKWTALRQGEAFPLGVAVRVGSDYRAASGVKDRWAGFAQLVLARRLGSAFDLFAVPTYVSDTPTLRHARNVGLGASVHFAQAWDISAEVIPANRDTKGSQVAWSVGAVKRVRGHTFLIYFGNSRATTTDLLAGSDIPGGFKSGDVRLGFNLVRRFPE
jgi:hypothetical protein